MLHYQISPPKKSSGGKSLPPLCEDDSGLPTYLVLGAFATIPKIHFETVKLGESKKRTLIIRNPCNEVTWLKLAKKPPAAFQLNLDSDEHIQPNGQVILDIVWTPAELGQCFHAFQFHSSITGIKFSVHLLGTCISPPKRNAKSRNRPHASSQNIPKPASENKGTVSEVENSKYLDRKEDGSLLESSEFFVQTNTTSSSLDANDSQSGLEIKNGAITLPPPATPTRDMTTIMLDSFAFPCTPDVKKSNPVNIGRLIPFGQRRETFLVEEEGLLQAQIASPTRRETYVVPPAEGNMSPDKKFFEFDDFESRIDAVLLKYDY